MECNEHQVFSDDSRRLRNDRLQRNCKQQYAGGGMLYDPLEKCELATCPMTCK